MYDVALMVAACLRAGTRVDVAWVVEVHGLPDVDRTDAVALTPGGGRVGSLLGGAADSRIADVVAGLGDHGRLVEVEVGDVDALIAGLPHGGSATVLVVPATQLPDDLWPQLDARQPVGLVCSLDGDEVTDIDLRRVRDPGDDVAPWFAAGTSTGGRTAGAVVSVFRPVPTLVVVGGGPNVASLEPLAQLLGWKVRRANDLGAAKGLVTALAASDSLVVTGHDPELAGAVVETALRTGAGYIGVLGGRRAQEQVLDWLALREVTDVARVHGPAGVDIGAQTPAEIALSVLAEAVAEHRAATPST